MSKKELFATCGSAGMSTRDVIDVIACFIGHGVAPCQVLPKFLQRLKLRSSSKLGAREMIGP